MLSCHLAALLAVSSSINLAAPLLVCLAIAIAASLLASLRTMLIKGRRPRILRIDPDRILLIFAATDGRTRREYFQTTFKFYCNQFLIILRLEPEPGANRQGKKLHPLVLFPDSLTDSEECCLRRYLRYGEVIGEGAGEERRRKKVRK